MNLPFFIAKRYLFSKRKKNFINILSWLSVVVVAFITAALVLVLSVFNGLGDLLENLNNSFDPELKIEAAEGKSFILSDSVLQQIKAVKGVQVVTEVIEDYVYLRYRDSNQIIILKGVGNNFLEHHRMDNVLSEGRLVLSEDSVDYAILGSGIAYNLSVAINDPMYPLQLYYVKDTKLTSLDPSDLYNKQIIIPGGIFRIVQNFDDNYVLVPLHVAASLMNSGKKRTSLEIKTDEKIELSAIQAKVKSILGSSYLVLSQQQQHKDLYRLLRMEKLFTFLAFTLLLVIGAINIFFSLMMLALDKQKDISVLMAMGADSSLIKRIFISEGAFISILGTVIGLSLGAVICWLQMKYSFVSMGMSSAVLQGYPIKPILSDFILTMFVVAAITIIIALRPAQLAAHSAKVKHL